MLNTYKRGRIWWVRGSYGGVRIKARSLDTSDRVVAEKRRRQIEIGLDSGENPSVKWPEFVQGYFAKINPDIATSTREKYERIIDRFVSFLDKGGVAHVGGVTTATIDGYLRDRSLDIHPTRKTPIGKGTLGVDLLILHGLFEHAVRCKILAENPVSLQGFTKRRDSETLPFAQAEIDATLGATSTPARRALILFFLYTGLRISDVSAMTKKAASGDRIIWKTQKRGKTVFLGVHPRLKEALAAHLEKMNLEQKTSAFLFPTRTGRQDHRNSIDAKLRRIWENAKVEHGHAHRFRDTFACKLLENGASLYDVAKLLGITMKVAEEHYAPYVKELQERGRQMVNGLDFSSAELKVRASGGQ